jgi:hypothetical protein
MFAAIPISRFSFLRAKIPFEEAKEDDKATESQGSANNESQDWTTQEPFTRGSGICEGEQPTQYTKQTNATNQQLHYGPICRDLITNSPLAKVLWFPFSTIIEPAEAVQ